MPRWQMLYSRKSDGVLLIVGLKKVLTVPSEGNLGIFWGLWETTEGFKDKVGGRIRLASR